MARVGLVRGVPDGVYTYIDPEGEQSTVPVCVLASMFTGLKVGFRTSKVSRPVILLLLYSQGV